MEAAIFLWYPWQRLKFWAGGGTSVTSENHLRSSCSSEGPQEQLHSSTLGLLLTSTFSGWSFFFFSLQRRPTIILKLFLLQPKTTFSLSVSHIHGHTDTCPGQRNPGAPAVRPHPGPWVPSRTRQRPASSGWMRSGLIRLDEVRPHLRPELITSETSCVFPSITSCSRHQIRTSQFSCFSLQLFGRSARQTN